MTLADGRTIGTPQDGNRARVAHNALGRGDIVPTYHPTNGRATSVSASGGVSYDIVIGGDYLYEITWRRTTGPSVTETPLPRRIVVLTYGTSIGTEASGALGWSQ